MRLSFKKTKRVLLFTVGCLWLAATPSPASEVITLNTPKKTEITGHIFHEAPSEQLEETDRKYAAMIKESDWHVRKISNSSSTYNGHGYAWHMSRGGEAVVLDGIDVQWYWMDGSYKEIDEAKAAKGDIIFMTDPDDPARTHSAVVSDQAGWCTSKWQDGPLYRHKFREHPFGKTLTFYRKAAPAAPQNLRIVTN